jgi:hypothetical protein
MVEEEVLLIVTDDEIMNVGLKLMGYSDQMIQRVQIDRTGGHCKGSPWTRRSRR